MKFFICIFLFMFPLFAQKIVFTPLPIWSVEQNLRVYSPLTRYLEKKLNLQVQFSHAKDYAQILNNFQNNMIDLAVMGPLPFALLTQQSSNAKAVAALNDGSKKSTYRCALIKFELDTIKKDNVKVALTQPLSTCGYQNTKTLLRQVYNIDMDKVKFEYLNSHTKAAQGVLSGNYTLAGVKDNIAKQYKSVGIQTVGLSQEVPGFVVVANTLTLDEKLIARIKQQLLNVPQEILKNMDTFLKYGMSEVDEEIYENLYKYEIKYPND